MTPDEIDRRIEALYGEVDWCVQTGVLHVAAIEAAGRRALIPGRGGPASETDRFILGFVRARADAVLSTGAILRAEPDLRHVFAEEAHADQAFTRWRAERLGRRETPELLLLSASGRFPLDHPAILSARNGIIWTSEAGARRLGPRVAHLEVRRIDDAPGGARAAVASLRAEGRVETIALEAGPSTAAAFYEEAGAREGCDELLLSTFASVDEGARENRVAASAIGPAFLPETQIRARFGDPVSRCERTEASGSWRFERYRGFRSIGQRVGPSGT
jgi:riboflavin biosynthesis pyrimidine reductase